MSHWKLTLAYDGTPYHGWQVQPGLPTIQGTLASALLHITGESVLPQGSGRTDAGVHALAQVATVSLDAAIPPANLLRALNRCLPPSIRVLSAEPAPPHFHARHSALRKTYQYRIFPLKPHPLPEPHPSPVPHSSQPYRDEWDTDTSQPHHRDDSDTDRICPPILAPYVWPCPWPLSLELLNRAASHICGAHDFTTFAAADPDLATRAASQTSESQTPAPEPPPTALRTIHHSAWTRNDGLLIYTVTGSGFLHHMVRNLVGTFVQVGAERLSPDSIPTLLAAHNRSAAGPTAPPQGLFLVSVDYPDPDGITSA